jgi:hypothetical protein
METLVEEGEPLQLHPDFCGFAWDDEWLSEVLQNPSELSQGCDLAMFFKMLWLITSQFGQEDGQRLWEDVRGHFGYPCACANVGENVRARDFNWQAFYDLLETHNLGRFRRALDVALCDTGNLFLDTSPDDYGYGLIEIPDFSAHNVLELRRLWQEAEGWLADYQACRALVLDDPGLYIRLVELWEQVCRSQPRTNRPKTLCELYLEKEQTMSQIHPFHDEDLQAEAALYFLPQGHYLFRWREETGLSGSKFVTADDLQAAFTDSERDTGWLAPGIVRAGYGKHGEWFVLHAPPQRIDIHILEMGTVSIPLPDLVLAGAGRSYYLWALQEPFSPLARLFDAPFPNIHNGGQICWGNNTPPAAHPANARPSGGCSSSRPSTAISTRAKPAAMPRTCASSWLS